MTLALLSLGSNLGDRRALMDEAVARIGKIAKTTVRARSSYYRTVPDGPIEQDWFVNLAVSVETGLSRMNLASACRAIEANLGRDREKEIPWGPRPMDVDVVLYGDEGELDERPFVVIPLAEIEPDLQIDGSTLAQRAALANARGVDQLDWIIPPL